MILRPEPGNSQSVARAKAKGLNAFGYPLFAIEAVDWTGPPASDFNALLLTSANAVRGLDAYCRLPVYAVGAATAEAARSAGLIVAKEGTNGVDAFLASLEPQKMFHPHGEDTTPTAPNGHEITQAITYRSRAVEPATPTWDALDEAPIVLLHSQRAIMHFAALTGQQGIDRSRISLVAISQAVANLAGSGWEAVALAAFPRDDAMIDAALALSTGSRG